MGKMMGRSTMSSLNEREWVDVPMRTVGLTCRITSISRRASLSGAARGQSATSDEKDEDYKRENINLFERQDERVGGKEGD
jgi:hypothetical protein